MAEAMACGTPVIGFKRGSVPEVIDEGITGFIVETFEEMCSSVLKIAQINRLNCRHHAQQKFDVPVIANKYLSLIDLP